MPSNVMANIANNFYVATLQLSKKFFIRGKPPSTALQQRLKIIVNNLSINYPILVALFVGKALTLYR